MQALPANILLLSPIPISYSGHHTPGLFCTDKNIIKVKWLGYDMQSFDHTANSRKTFTKKGVYCKPTWHVAQWLPQCGRPDNAPMGLDMHYPALLVHYCTHR